MGPVVLQDASCAVGTRAPLYQVPVHGDQADKRVNPHSDLARAILHRSQMCHPCNYQIDWQTTDRDPFVGPLRQTSSLDPDVGPLGVATTARAECKWPCTLPPPRPFKQFPVLPCLLRPPPPPPRVFVSFFRGSSQRSGRCPWDTYGSALLASACARVVCPQVKWDTSSRYVLLPPAPPHWLRPLGPRRCSFLMKIANAAGRVDQCKVNPAYAQDLGGFKFRCDFAIVNEEAVRSPVPRCRRLLVFCVGGACTRPPPRPHGCHWSIVRAVLKNSFFLLRTARNRRQPPTIVLWPCVILRTAVSIVEAPFGSVVATADGPSIPRGCITRLKHRPQGAHPRHVLRLSPPPPPLSLLRATAVTNKHGVPLDRVHQH